MFSYLNQEEERIKKMAHLSYQIENNNKLGSNKKQENAGVGATEQ